MAEVQALATLTAPEISHEPTVKAPPAKKRGATIGSAPQLNAQGLIAAAELAREKEVVRLRQVRGAWPASDECWMICHDCVTAPSAAHSVLRANLLQSSHLCSQPFERMLP